MPPICFNFSHS